MNGSLWYVISKGERANCGVWQSPPSPSRLAGHARKTGSRVRSVISNFIYCIICVIVLYIIFYRLSLRFYLKYTFVYSIIESIVKIRIIICFSYSSAKKPRMEVRKHYVYLALTDIQNLGTKIRVKQSIVCLTTSTHYYDSWYRTLICYIQTTQTAT